jgi:hypothetical protein
MWLAAALGCGGPQDALTEAQGALDRGDRAAFERVVDVAEVVPEVGAACAQLSLVRNLADQELGLAPRMDQALFGLVAGAMAGSPESGEAWLGLFRQGFPRLPVTECPALAVQLDRAVVTRVDRDHATASVPVAGAGFDAAWTLLLERRDGEWRVTHADGGPLVDAWRAHELQVARERAEALVAGLADGAPHDDWTMARAYLRRHPEATALAERYTADLAAVSAAAPVLPTSAVGFFQPRGWFRNRHVGATVRNPTPRAAREVVVRFSFEDAAGDEVVAGSLDALVVVARELPAGGEVTVASPASRGTWPDAARATATVVAVTWGDGSTWRHPAVEAGAWSPFPTDQPVSP